MIIYGGSFNPPTKAHKKIVNKIERKMQEKVYLIPTSQKRYPHKTNLLDDEKRIAMLKIAFPNNVILDDEMKDLEFRGTYELLKKYKELKNETIYFVLGEDNLKKINTWLNSEKLITEFKFLVLTRGKESVQLPNNNFQKIKIKARGSSTKARTTLGKKENRKYLTKKIRNYIKKEGLYV